MFKYEKEADGVYGLTDVQSCFIRIYQKQCKDVCELKQMMIYKEYLTFVKKFRKFNGF